MQVALRSTNAREFESEFDGIWACASLLHIARRDFDSALARLTKALKTNGVLYISVKHGDSEGIESGRFFNDLKETLLVPLIANNPQLELVRIWITEDVRNDCWGHLSWLNAVVRRRSKNDRL
jgi:hypothetical protein